ncbi:hypothetical protein C7451_103296 [Blastomonas natatoria]|uniref:Uncharacterized protein n=1 Tax=Blastomonas natatoria TaxID=34015 RepID=A0A2V3VBS2_9SPHN|nr:hypothetical protein [Blastomonas natatoria]PXW78188.1 hypothetical protein C7451_103296 [Blastomonas natatoria]
MSISVKLKATWDGLRATLSELYPVLKQPITVLICLLIVLGIGGVAFKVVDKASDKIAAGVSDAILPGTAPSAPPSRLAIISMHLLNDRSALLPPEGPPASIDRVSKFGDGSGFKGCITSSPDQAIPFLARAVRELSDFKINTAVAAVLRVKRSGNVYGEREETRHENGALDAEIDLGRAMARMDLPFSDEFFDKLVAEVSTSSPSYTLVTGASEAPVIEFVLQNEGQQSVLLTDIGVKILATSDPPQLEEGSSSQLDGAHILPVVAEVNIIEKGSSRGSIFKLDDPIVIPARGFARLKVTLQFNQIDGVGVGGWSAQLKFLGGSTELGLINEICYIERLTLF